MTLDEFAAVITSRIPTPGEFLSFAERAGWRVVARPDGTAGLRVPDVTDPVARAFARVLSCEPYRTNVLKAIGVTARPGVMTLPPPPPPSPVPEVVPPAPPAADPADGWVCRVCARTFWVSEAEVREFADSPAVCDRAGAQEVRNRHTGGIVHPAAERCPYKSREAV